MRPGAVMRSVLRLGVTLALLLPMMLLFGGGWLGTFAVALFSFSAGRIVERLVFGPAEGTQAPPRWLWPVVALAGLLMLGAVSFIEYRLAREQERAVEAMLRSRKEAEQVTMQARQAATGALWRIEIAPDGSLRSDGRQATLETLSIPAHTTRAEITADGAVPHAEVIAVIDAIRALGVQDFSLITR